VADAREMTTAIRIGVLSGETREVIVHAKQG
jgi:hypothetical protein